MERDPTREVTSAEAREHLGDVINRAAYGGERIVLTRRGKPIAAVVSIEDADWLDEIEEKADREALRAAREDFRRGETVPLDQVLRDHGVER